MTRVTMHDIAQHAGVSQSTVSLVLNNRLRARGSISEETQQRVLSAAAALNYRRNELAKAMVTGKNRVLGVLMTPYISEYSIRILTGANEAADQLGYLQKIMHLGYDKVNENVVARCQEWRLAGVMIFGFREEQISYLHDLFAHIGMPVALVDNSPYHSRWGARFRSDDGQAIPMVISHLMEKGHKHIGFLGGDPSNLSSWREEIFRKTLREAGLTVRPNWIQQGAWNDEARMEAGALALLRDATNRPTAVVCSSDTIAMMALRVGRSLGLRLPADLSVTGYSNTSYSAFTDPALTTVDQHFDAIGRAAAEYLIDRAESEEPETSDEPVRDILLPTNLVIRGSTAPPPQ